MRTSTVGILAAVAAVAFAQTAEAQICAGFPSSERGFYFGARADFPSGLDSFGVEANYNASGPLGLFGGMNVVSVEDTDDSDFNAFNVGAAFELASLGAFIGPRVSTCPVVEAIFSDADNSAVQVPVGLGFGGDIGVPGINAGAYVIPQLMIVFPSGDADTYTDFALRGGAMVGFGQISVGGEIRHVFIDGADPTFGIRVGIRL